MDGSSSPVRPAPVSRLSRKKISSNRRRQQGSVSSFKSDESNETSASGGGRPLSSGFEEEYADVISLYNT